MLNKKPASFLSLWLFGIGLFIFMLGIPLLQKGMFLDGVIYAAIAKNMSLGIGTLWAPYFNSAFLPAFYEHPPLVFFLQSLFFGVLGEHFPCEQLYSFLMALLLILMMHYFWITTPKKPASSSCILLILWLACPLNHAYISNMLESTVTLFTTLASFILIYSSRPPFLFRAFLSSLCMVIAFFCNGPTAFFPLVIPILVAIVENSSLSQGVKKSLTLTSFLIILGGITFIVFPEALVNIRNYLHQQLFPSIKGGRNPEYTGLEHLHILILYLRAIALPAALSLGVMWWAQRLKPLAWKKKDIQLGLLFLGISLIASLPVGLSPRQAFNYIMPSAPFISLSFLYLSYPAWETLIHYYEVKLGKTSFFLSVLFLLLSVYMAVTSVGKYQRDHALLHDIATLSSVTNIDKAIALSPALSTNWQTQAYLARYTRFEIKKESAEYYLSLNSENSLENYNLLPIPLLQLALAQSIQLRHVS